MQSIFQLNAFIGARALSVLTGPAAGRSVADGLLRPLLVAVSRLPPSLTTNSGASTTSAAAAPSCGQSLHTSPSAPSQEALATASTSGTPPVSLLSQHAPILPDGSRSADPGEPRYSAPYWIPEDVRKASNLPAVLFTDPWNPHDEPETRRRHARLCYDLLLQSPRPLTAEQVRDAINDRLRQQHQQHAASSGAASAGTSSPPAPQPPPLLATTAYVKQLLEHMRRTRLLYGKKNPESLLSAGHREHPRLYVALKYQAARFGNPAQLAQEDAERRQKQVERAFKRLRHGKPPYAIHRRRAYFSLWQHELAQEALRGDFVPPAVSS